MIWYIPGELLQTEAGRKRICGIFSQLGYLPVPAQHRHMEGLGHRNQPSGNHSTHVMREGLVYKAERGVRACYFSRPLWNSGGLRIHRGGNQVSLIIKSPRYTGGDFMFLYRFVRRRRRRRLQILVHAITFEQLFGFLSFLARLLALTYRLTD